MIQCPSCGADVTGKKFCSGCGHAVQAAPSRSCPICHAQVGGESAFCTNCGHDMHAAAAAPSFLVCSSCGQQNAAHMRFCGNCGNALAAATPAPYQQQPYQQPSYQPQPGQQPYYNQPNLQYGASPAYNQGGYQPQPMMNQGPMVLRCPTCMAMAPVGTPACRSCQTSLFNIVPTPANMPVQGQQGGFLQGDAGKYAMGALGGLAVGIGGEMLFNGLENSLENRVEGDMGYGGRHHHHHREEGILGELGSLADDIGL